MGSSIYFPYSPTFKLATSVPTQESVDLQESTFAFLNWNSRYMASVKLKYIRTLCLLDRET